MNTLRLITALTAYLLFVGTTFLSCQTKSPSTQTEPSKKPSLGKPLTFKGTLYYVNKKAYKKDKSGVAVRTPDGSIITYLSKRDFCRCAMEGSCKVTNGKEIIIGYHSRSKTKTADCAYRPSSYATFFVDKNPYGTGNKGNPLFPHFSVACDQSRFKFGQWFYIPEFVGVSLPNGRKHEGYFRCDDIGGLIKGNHLDFFIGKVESWKKHPFLKLATGKQQLKVYLVEGKK